MCKYCEKEEAITLMMNEDVFDIQVLDDFLYVWCACGKHQTTQINYCPMCGKKLGGANNGR